MGAEVGTGSGKSFPRLDNKASVNVFVSAMGRRGLGPGWGCVGKGRERRRGLLRRLQRASGWTMSGVRTMVISSLIREGGGIGRRGGQQGRVPGGACAQGHYCYVPATAASTYFYDSQDGQGSQQKSSSSDRFDKVLRTA